jgi:hypothetical protein
MEKSMIRLTTLARLVVVAAACAGFFASEARADGDRARLSLAPKFVATASYTSGLRMVPIVSSAITERPGDSKKEQLRRMKHYRTLGIAAAVGTAAVLGGVIAGPAYGTAAGAAVLITYLVLP